MSNLEYIVALLPIEEVKDYEETAIAAFAFEEDAQAWMEQSRYNAEELKLYHIPNRKNG